MAYSQTTYDRALELRLAGLTLSDISSRCGVSPTQISRWCQRERVEPHEHLKYVYFIYADRVERMKVGYARDVSNRLSSLRVSSPVRLELLGKIQTREPQGVERQIHQQLSNCNFKGEWFDVCRTKGEDIIRNYGGELAGEKKTVGSYTHKLSF